MADLLFITTLFLLYRHGTYLLFFSPRSSATMPSLKDTGTYTVPVCSEVVGVLSCDVL
jgi:hypothetical protein